MTWSTDVAAGALDICLGIAAVVLIAVLASRKRRETGSPGEPSEKGAQRLIRRRRVTARRAGIP